MTTNIIKKASFLDSQTHTLKPYFRIGSQVSGEGGWFTDPRWWCESAERVLGPKPGRALINIPMRAESDEEQAYSVAFSPNGPAAAIKIGARVLIQRCWTDEHGSARAQPCFVGKVLEITHDAEEDTISVVAVDVRHELQPVRVIGRHVYNPPTGQVYYQQGWKAHFNPGGRPNCIHDLAGYPCFAPYPDYGIEGDEVPAYPEEGHHLVACYWTLGKIFEYLAVHYGPDSAVQTNFEWLPRCPSYVIWPYGLGASLDDDSQMNFDAGGGSRGTGSARAGREMILEGISILDAMQQILDGAGGYMLDVVPGDFSASGSFTATLSVVPTLYQSDSQATTLPMGQAGAALPNRAVVNGGSLTLSGENLVTRLGAASALVAIETMCEMPTGLEWSHTQARFDAWRQALAAITSEEQFEEVNQRFPDVACYLRLPSTFNFQAWTSQAGHSRAPIPRQVFPHLLSMVSNGSLDFAGMRYPIWFEVEVTTGNWQPLTPFNGLESLDNGNLHLPGPRSIDAPLRTWKVNSGNEFPPFNTVGGLADISMRNVRCCLAIPCDHRMTIAYKLTEDLMSGENAALSIGSSLDVEHIDPEHSRPEYLDLGDLYGLWLRQNSYPEPKSLSSQAPDLASAVDALRSDHDLMISHVARRLWQLGRLQKSGKLLFNGWLVGGCVPGTQIRSLAPVAGGPEFPIRSVIVGVRWVVGPEESATEVYLA